MRRTIQVTTLAMAFGTICQSAWSQMAAVKQEVSQPSKVSVEVKPLPTTLSYIPGTGAFGMGAEFSGGTRVAVFLNGTILNANLPSRLRNKENEEKNPQLQRMTGYAGDLGIRIYQYPLFASSWYGGTKVGYAYAKSQWGYGGEKFDQSVRTLTPGLEGGYQWTWDSNILLRLGGGADGNIVQENRTGSDTDDPKTREGEDKVKAYARVAVVPRVDLGLGYVF